MICIIKQQTCDFVGVLEGEAAQRSIEKINRGAVSCAISFLKLNVTVSSRSTIPVDLVLNLHHDVVFCFTFQPPTGLRGILVRRKRPVEAFGLIRFESEYNSKSSPPEKYCGHCSVPRCLKYGTATTHVFEFIT